MKIMVLPVVVALCASASNAGGKGNLIGQFKAEILDAADAPVAIHSASVQDSERKSNAGVLLSGPEQTFGNVRYDVSFDARETGVIAVEVEFQAVNGFDEVVGAKRIAFSYKKPLHVGFTKYDNESGTRIHDDVAKYRVRVVRAKFADGHLWAAQEATSPAATAPSAPAKPE